MFGCRCRCRCEFLNPLYFYTVITVSLLKQYWTNISEICIHKRFTLALTHSSSMSELSTNYSNSINFERVPRFCVLVDLRATMYLAILLQYQYQLVGVLKRASVCVCSHYFDLKIFSPPSLSSSFSLRFYFCNFMSQFHQFVLKCIDSKMCIFHFGSNSLLLIVRPRVWWQVVWAICMFYALALAVYAS